MDEKFQNLKANTYGVLPVALDDVFYRCSKSDTPGYYIYGKYDFLDFGQEFCIYASDYVNMNTICKRTVKDGVDWSGVNKLSYYEDYYEYMGNFDIFYQSAVNPKIQGVIPLMSANSVFSGQEKHGIFKEETLSAAALKKKSDSFRTQFYRKNLSGLFYDRKCRGKGITLNQIIKMYIVMMSGVFSRCFNGLKKER